MDQTALATLLQANQEQAAAKMARVFREKMSKEDKRDKFGDAGKAVRQPEVFHRKNLLNGRLEVRISVMALLRPRKFQS